MKRFWFKKPASVLAVTAIAVGVVAPTASALEVGPLTVEISVETSNWSACGTVSDDLTNANYTAVLTATGFESSIGQNGVILNQASAGGNPALPCTPGGFSSSYAAVEYTLEWTSITGTTGSLTKTCAEADLGATVSIHPDIELAPPIHDVLERLMAVNRPVCTVS
jgi:hypothetical protein